MVSLMIPSLQVTSVDWPASAAFLSSSATAAPLLPARERESRRATLLLCLPEQPPTAATRAALPAEAALTHSMHNLLMKI